MYFSNTSFEFVGGNVKALFLKGLLCLAVNQPLFVSYPNWTITPLQLNAVLKLDSKGLGSPTIKLPGCPIHFSPTLISPFVYDDPLL